MGLTVRASVVVLRVGTGYGDRLRESLRAPWTDPDQQEQDGLVDPETGTGAYAGPRGWRFEGEFRKVEREQVLAHLLGAPWSETWDAAVITADDDEVVAVATLTAGRVDVVRYSPGDGTCLRSGFMLAKWRDGTVPDIGRPMDWPSTTG